MNRTTALPDSAAELSIPRVRGLRREEMLPFLDKATSQAVILTDIVSDWPAFKKWTPSFIEEVCGADQVVVSDDLAEPQHLQKISLADYLEYMRDPEGHWLTKKKPEVVWYAGYYSPLKHHPELLDDFSVPDCLDSWFVHLDEPMQQWYQNGFGWLLLGPAGTKTAAHFDLFNTHAWTAQIMGTKRFIFFPPDRKEPFDDLERITQQEPIEVVLAPGEFMVIPADWCHAAEALEPSMTLTFNFVNQTNFSRFLHAIYLYQEKWQIKAKDPEIRKKMGLQE